MKILHVGLSATGTPLNGLQKALMKLGDYEEINTATKDLNAVMRDRSDSFRPDLVWIQIQTAGYISNETVIYLKKNGAKIINWSGDCRSPIPAWYLDLGMHIDLTAFSNMNDVDTLNSQGIRSEFLQIGYDPEIYTPVGGTMPMQEIVFMGNNLVNQFPLSKYRADMVAFLKETYGSQFNVYGSGWNNSNGSFNHNQRAESMVYRSCKIAINCSHFDYRRYTSDRMFRILGSGAFCLTKWYPEIEVDFVDGMHLSVWKDFDELKEKIDYYLYYERERNWIAENGHLKAIKKYRFDNMAQNIKELYERL